MKHLGQNGQIDHFVFEKESKKESMIGLRDLFGVCTYLQRNGTITT